MYPNEKYMNDSHSKDLNFTPLSSEILNNIYNPIEDINFYTPIIMKEPFRENNTIDKAVQTQSYIRFFNSVHSKGNMDIYINSQLIKKNIKYSAMTSYIKIPEGTYTIRVYKSGTNNSPMMIYKIEIKKDCYYTLSIIEDNNKLKLIPLIDKKSDVLNNTNGNIIFVRFINLIPFSPPLNVTINEEEQLINGVEYGESTNYINLPSNTYSFEIFPTDKRLKSIVVPKALLSPGTYYTIFAIGRADLPGAHQALLYKDAD